MKRTKTSDPNIYQIESGVFYYRLGDYEVSLKTKDFKEALKRKRTIENKNDGLATKALVLRVEDVAGDYLADREKEFADGKIRQATLTECRWIMNQHVLPFFSRMKLNQVDSVSWAKYKKSATLKDLFHVRKVFGHFLKWCVVNGYSRTVPILTIDQVKRRKLRILKPQEIEGVWSHSTGSLKLFIALALSMGLRRTEIMTLEWDRIFLDRKALFLPSTVTKTHEERWVTISQSVQFLLSERSIDQVGSGLKTPWVFPHAYDPKRHAYKGGLMGSWKRVKIKAFNEGLLPDLNFTWHDLRATCEYYAHKRSDLSETQLEKFFGADIKVQRKRYVTMLEDDVRGVENSLSLPVDKS